MQLRLCAAPALASIAISAAAQSFNLDMGEVSGIPSSSYGAAAAQTGLWDVWNGMNTNPHAIALLDGSYAGVFIRQNLPFGIGYSDSPDTFDDDAALLDDYLVLRSTSARHRITGLAPGEYKVFVYAWPPDVDFFRTAVSVNGQFLGQIGGAWPGGFSEGITHGRADIALKLDQSVLIQSFGLGSGTMNGLQVVAGVRYLTVAPAGELPLAVPPNTAAELDFIIDPHDETIVGTPLLYSVIGDQTTSDPMTPLGGNLWRGRLALGECGNVINYYVVADGSIGGSQRYPFDPPSDPNDPNDPNAGETYLDTEVGYLQTETLLVTGFESGLPAGWSADGLWHVTNACAPGPSCEGTQFAYYGQDDRCDYENAEVASGVLMTSEIDLPELPWSAQGLQLTFCQALATEGDGSPDLTQIRVNGEFVADMLQTPDWQRQRVDLGSYGGQTVRIEFNFDTQGLGADTYRGWHVDDVRVTSRILTCSPACVGDVDRDGDVDLTDLALLLANFGTGGGARLIQGDIDGDGDIDLTDLARLLSNFGTTCE